MSDFDYLAAKNKAVKKAGGTNELARKLGISPSAVSQWKKVPSGRVLKLEGLTSMRRSEIRPDLYPEE